MQKVKFNLKHGQRIGNYSIVRRIGSGCTAEAYLVEEIPTSARRVLKLYEMYEDVQRVINIKNFAHYCWFLEELSDIGILPRYYHMGHTFIENGDGVGQYFLVQEYINGANFSVKKCTDEMISNFRNNVSKVHNLGYALGDMKKENMVISSGAIRMVDCEYGTHDNPNTNTKADITAMNELFGK